MLTESIISILKNDSTIRTALGATTANNAPIQAGFAINKVSEKLIAVGSVYGESNHTGYENGTVRIEVYWQATSNNPIEGIHAISERIITLLDMKGSSLIGVSGVSGYTGSFCSTIYRLRKTSFEITYDEVSQCHVGMLDFEFFVTR